jgi:MSHA pilin protein MshA
LFTLTNNKNKFILDIIGKNMNTINNQKQKGFTLIELVIVIVILGILAATAAPKFLNLQADAKEATLQAVKASVETAMSVVYAKSLINGTETAATSTVNTPTVVNTVYGYPKAAAADFANLLELAPADFLYVDIAGTPNKVLIYPTGMTAPTAAGASCTVEYTEATSATAKATVVVNTGC